MTGGARIRFTSEAGEQLVEVPVAAAGRPEHFALRNDDGTKQVSACGLTYEPGMRFTDDPFLVTCQRRACQRVAAEERAYLAELLQRCVGAYLIFLDYDGVLNHAAFFAWRKAEREAGRLPPMNGPGAVPMSLDRACVARLNGLIETTGALVVVSSSWRQGSTVRRLQKTLDGYGFAGTVVGMTTDSAAPAPGSLISVAKPRGDEIRAFLDALPAPPSGFVALDDERHLEAIAEHAVYTDHYAGGLTDEKVDEAIRVLQRGWP